MCRYRKLTACSICKFYLARLPTYGYLDRYNQSREIARGCQSINICQYSCKILCRGKVMSNEKVMEQERLFTDHVRFVGDRIAAVIAENLTIAKEACSLINLKIKPLKPLLNVDDSLKEREVRIHEEGNFIDLGKVGFGNYENAEGDVHRF